MKIHYVGYSELYDEWCLESEIVVKSLTVQHDTQDGGGAVCVTLPYVFSLYRELALRIKQCLTSSRKSSLIVKIEMPFDKVQYDGGLKLYGQLKCTRQGITLVYMTRDILLFFLLCMRMEWAKSNPHILLNSFTLLSENVHYHYLIKEMLFSVKNMIAT